MRENREHQEMRPDPVLGAVLRSAGGHAPLEEVDWEVLRQSIRERAELPLARRRAGRSRSTPRWIRPLLPLAAAASVAMAVWIGGIGRAGPEAVTEQAGLGSASVSAEEALLADVSDQEFRLLVSGRGNPDALLMIAVSER